MIVLLLSLEFGLKTGDLNASKTVSDYKTNPFFVRDPYHFNYDNITKYSNTRRETLTLIEIDFTEFSLFVKMFVRTYSSL